MQDYDLEGMSLEELWNLHEKIADELTRKLSLEKAKLDERLSKLHSASYSEHRPYPKVLAKYCNPKNPSETWAGCGKQPRWLAAQLRSGKSLITF